LRIPLPPEPVEPARCVEDSTSNADEDDEQRYECRLGLRECGCRYTSDEADPKWRSQFLQGCPEVSPAECRGILPIDRVQQHLSEIGGVNDARPIP